jgi:hypothetical protein
LTSRRFTLYKKKGYIFSGVQNMPTEKKCSKCGIKFPATFEFFTRDKHKRDGLTTSCKACRKEASRKYREENPDKIRESFHKYYAENAEWMRERILIYRTENPEKVRESSRRYYEENRESELERTRKYKAENPEKIKEYNHNYRAENLEKERERGRKYYAENVEIIREKNRRYREQNPEKIRIINRDWQARNLDKLVIIAQRHRTRKRELPDTLSLEQWNRAVIYWKECCAYCGKETKNLFGNSCWVNLK